MFWQAILSVERGVKLSLTMIFSAEEAAGIQADVERCYYTKLDRIRADCSTYEATIPNGVVRFVKHGDGVWYITVMHGSFE